MANRVSLDDITPKQFDDLADLLAETVAERQVTIRIWVPSLVELIFDSANMSDLLDARGLPVEPCLSQLALDIPIMISAVLMGRQNSAARYLATDTLLTGPEFSKENNNEDTELIRSELLERCAILEDRVISSELRNRYAVKVTAKNNVLTATEWEVIQRQADSTKDSAMALTYATVRFISQKPPISLTGIGPESESFTVILTREEIVELQASLKKALRSIEQAMQSEDSQ